MLRKSDVFEAKYVLADCQSRCFRIQAYLQPLGLCDTPDYFFLAMLDGELQTLHAADFIDSSPLCQTCKDWLQHLQSRIDYLNVTQFCTAMYSDCLEKFQAKLNDTSYCSICNATCNTAYEYFQSGTSADEECANLNLCKTEPISIDELEQKPTTSSSLLPENETSTTADE